MSTEIFPLTSKGAADRKTRLWLSYQSGIGIRFWMDRRPTGMYGPPLCRKRKMRRQDGLRNVFGLGWSTKLLALMECAARSSYLVKFPGGVAKVQERVGLSCADMIGTSLAQIVSLMGEGNLFASSSAHAVLDPPHIGVWGRFSLRLLWPTWL